MRVRSSSRTDCRYAASAPNHAHNALVMRGARAIAGPDPADGTPPGIPSDPLGWHEDTLWIDLASLGLPAVVEAYDELSGQTFVWDASPYVRLEPDETPAHILHLRAR